MEVHLRDTRYLPLCTTRNAMQGATVRLGSPFQSQPMSQLSDNLTSRRELLGMDVTEIHVALNRLGLDVAYSTVAGWFNGSRGVRSLKHLNALCVVLQTDLNSLGGEDEIEMVEGPVRVTAAREMKELSETQQEAVLAVIRSMKESK